MDQVSAWRGRIVALDTAPLIYYIEDHSTYAQRIDPFIEALEQGTITIITATITLVEVLVQPYRRGDLPLMQRYRNILLNATGVRAIPLTPNIAEEAARLRATHTLSPPDAIQLVTALYGRGSRVPDERPPPSSIAIASLAHGR